jgi:ribosomal protein RSM22 (predicted rRNA methylase)
MVTLPEELEAAIGEALRALPSSQWVGAARSLSARYRAHIPSTEGQPRPGRPRALARGAEAALGYAALVMPATYAQLSGAMRATAERAPHWQPATLLDLGSGPGTALWAATERWPSLRSLAAWEREPAFIALGRQLAARGRNRTVAAARWERVLLDRPLPAEAAQYDLVVLGHVLNELSEPVRQRVVAYAWDRCAGVVLVVEPGTPAAFQVVRAAREQLLALGARTLAPCAHDDPCPLAGDWCHFPELLRRPAFQRRAKGAPAGWEASKVSYAALARFTPELPIWGRLLHQPHVHKAYVELTVSARPGVARYRIPKQARPAFDAARRLRWGDVLHERPEGAL